MPEPVDQPVDLHLPVTADAVATLMERLEDFAGTARLPARLAGHLMLACEELAANIVEHGAGATAMWVSVRPDGAALRVEVSDDGPAFDPLSAGAPDVGAALEDRDPGGLGLHLVREIAAEIRYARLDGRNRVSLVLGGADRTVDRRD